MQLDSTRKHIITENNNLGSNQLCITNVGTSNFGNIDTPIPLTKKCTVSYKTLRWLLLEQEAVV